MYASLILIAFAFSTCTIALLLRSPLRYYFGDSPDHRKVHQQIIPRLGGLGIILALLAVETVSHFLFSDAMPFASDRLTLVLLFLSLFLIASGSMDDIKPISFKLKFLFQFALAAVVVFYFGYDFERINLFGHTWELGVWGSILSLFWMVGVMNAFNIIDGIDGLAGGVALCAFATLAILGNANGAQGMVFVSLVMGGLILGFLVHNFSPTNKVFLGDTGSQFLGAVLGMLTMRLMELPLAAASYSFFVPLLILGYPIFDISVAMVRRFKCHGHKKLLSRLMHMFHADNEHLHHRMVYLGMSHIQSTFLLVLVAASLSSAAVIISRVETGVGLAVTGYLVLSLFLILNRLGYLGNKSWIYIPRMKQLPGSIVGLIDPDEVFTHSLKNFNQNKFEFLAMDQKMTKFLGHDLAAVLLYNADPEKFEDQWTQVLREAEFHDCKAVVIAGHAELEKIRKLNPDGFSSVQLMEKPVRVPDLIRELENHEQVQRKSRPKVVQVEQKLSLAQLALKKAKDERQQA